MSVITVGQLVEWNPHPERLDIGTVMAVYARQNGDIAVVDPLDTSCLANVPTAHLRPLSGGEQT